MEGRRPRLTRGDWLLPAVLAVVGVGEVFTVDDLPRLPGLVAVLLPCALLVGRRPLPLVFATPAVGVVMLSSHLGLPDDALTTPLLVVFAGCFALGRHERVAARGALVLVALNTAFHLLGAWRVPLFGDVLWAGGLSFLPWFFGRLVLAHARQSEQLAEQGRRLVEEQRQVAERAVADERRRIARELHDVIAHAVSVMVVQAGAARELVGSDDVAADAALDEVQRAGRGALTETGRLLGLLRAEEDCEVTPQPSVDDVARLVEDFRGSGLDVSLAMRGSTAGLPAALELSVFRIVEEGLTNALKHAPGARVHIDVRRENDAVEVAITSDGGGPRVAPSGGHGLVGMRERVAMFGGSLSTGPTDTGGYLVDARLPVGETP
ncbi:two-component sensor histidine kinase [Aeromicrobium flavum]|uniref:histidine kinase n=1 Tax=Aeromicrobium flavum TaxID=416568 RepID=A0A512HUQ4_9ACTN|nr:histidine kinase [Aeromicrobium flavum]GEO89174.1 two-component sensor histidine kinase [Aeromicrobium flavum]